VQNEIKDHHITFFITFSPKSVDSVSELSVHHSVKAFITYISI